ILGKEYVFIKNMVEEEAKKGKRVLLLAKFHGEELSDSLLGKIGSCSIFSHSRKRWKSKMPSIYVLF
ncbi:hypothetical protein, partial [Clostridium butyricum]|uniref:hypothetical protein n=1 Tax=Clostridium butyricum TaxID=1492 RepID=UPI002105A523